MLKIKKRYSVGDRVAYNTNPNRRSSSAFTHLAVVVRVGALGSVWLENGMRFDNKGNQIATYDFPSPRAVLCDLKTAEAIHENARKQREQKNAVEELTTALKNRSNAFGKFDLTAEQLKAIKSVTDLLKSSKK